MEERVRTERLVETHISLAERIARRLAWLKRVTSSEEREEMRADAALGLVQAANSWREDKGVPFGAFARLRIAGAVYNGLRRRQSRIPTVSLEALALTN